MGNVLGGVWMPFFEASWWLKILEKTPWNDYSGYLKISKAQSDVSRSENVIQNKLIKGSLKDGKVLVGVSYKTSDY